MVGETNERSERVEAGRSITCNIKKPVPSFQSSVLTSFVLHLSIQSPTIGFIEDACILDPPPTAKAEKSSAPQKLFTPPPPGNDGWGRKKKITPTHFSLCVVVLNYIIN